jgi:hypothetical protein
MTTSSTFEHLLLNMIDSFLIISNHYAENQGNPVE